MVADEWEIIIDWFKDPAAYTTNPWYKWGEFVVLTLEDTGGRIYAATWGFYYGHLKIGSDHTGDGPDYWRLYLHGGAANDGKAQTLGGEKFCTKIMETDPSPAWTQPRTPTSGLRHIQ